MTNKPMLSVEREVIEKALRDALTIRFDTDSHVTKLRAILDKQAPEPVPVAWMRFDDDQKAIFTRTKRADKSEPLYAHPTAYRHSKPAAQHQGEPVAWVIGTADGNGADYYPGKGLDTLEIGAKLYAEQSAPVAVVMPGRKTKADYSGYIEQFQSEAAGLYNSALDDVARMNEVKP